MSLSIGKYALCMALTAVACGGERRMFGTTQDGEQGGENGLLGTVQWGGGDAGGTQALDASSGITDGGTGGTESNKAGAGGAAGAGGQTSASPGGSGGAIGAIMKCAEEDDGCICDQAGCFLATGSACVLDEDCKTQSCGVTQDSANVCCVQECDEGQVCSADGTSCEAEAQCEGDTERCNDDYQQCVDGNWETEEACGGRGCDLSRGGCLAAAGTACTDSSTCGEGTCQPTVSGAEACCTSTCGKCQICSDSGDSCVEPATVPSGCECTSSDATQCQDTLSCTDDVCVNGACQNPIKAGSCLINGQCVDQGQADPGNPCRSCSPVSDNQGWTNASAGTSCDDGVWCNGDNDQCNSSGLCTHSFTNNDRCAASTGACEAKSCSESRKNCFQPNTHICLTETNVGCLSSSCSSDVMSWKIDHYCRGDRADCSGGQQVSRESQATIFDVCQSTEVCDPGTQECALTVACGDTFCDSSSGLCWMASDSAGAYSQSAAKTFCSQLDFAGSLDWHLPTNAEARTVTRGCSDFCDAGDGPGVDGCYWPTEMGPCSNNLWLDNTASGYWVPINAAIGYTAFGDYKVRCVTALP